MPRPHACSAQGDHGKIDLSRGSALPGSKPREPVAGPLAVVRNRQDLHLAASHPVDDRTREDPEQRTPNVGLAHGLQPSRRLADAGDRGIEVIQVPGTEPGALGFVVGDPREMLTLGVDPAL